MVCKEKEDSPNNVIPLILLFVVVVVQIPIIMIVY